MSVSGDCVISTIEMCEILRIASLKYDMHSYDRPMIGWLDKILINAFSIQVWWSFIYRSNNVIVFYQKPSL